MTQSFSCAEKSDMDRAFLHVRGRCQYGVHLDKLTWFKVGGAADVIFKPQDQDDLSVFLRQNTLPLWTLGAGSNVIVRDGGVPGVTLRLTGEFARIHVYETAPNTFILEAGAGCLDRTVALTAKAHALQGLEFLISVPGTIGGAVRMNAGAYGAETQDHLLWVDVMTEAGVHHRLFKKDIAFGYRMCDLPPHWIIIKAAFQLAKGDGVHISKRMQSILKAREETQPTKGRTGGSTFKNPSGNTAWKLIDEAGCRGLKRGDAQMSEQHCNFMLNLGKAYARDLEALGEDVRKRVLETCGVALAWEIKRIGQP